MNISKEVIRDLLPAYVAGEASAETRALMENALAGDAGLRDEAATIGTVPPADVTPPANLGIDALRRTQRLLRRRTLLVGFSVFFSTFPLAVVGRPWGLAGRLGETACLLVAAAGWALFLKNAARLHALGLEGPRSPHPVMAWYCATTVFATSALFCVQDWTGLDLGAWTALFLLLFWTPVYWIGRRLHQLRASPEIREVESLLTLAREPDA
jgi:hypothetical protein